jgi:hypothetical protein
MAVKYRRSEITLVLVFLLQGSGLRAEETNGDEVERKEQLSLMEKTVASLDISSDVIRDKTALTFAARPLLRYSDPTRGSTEANVLLDATVWRLGEKGRPTALVTLEIYRATVKESLLSYEFASLTPDKFSLRHKTFDKVTWQATGSALSMTPLAEAPAPTKTASGRLTQMRQLARRFAVREKLRSGQSLECRLLAQPIDRYSAAESKITDGAIFAYANGTNPELGLVLECDDAKWSYGTVRLSSAELAVDLDGHEVASYPVGDFRSKSGTYSAAQQPLEAAP